MSIWFWFFISFWVAGGTLAVLLSFKILYRWNWLEPFRKHKLGGVLDYAVPFLLSWVGIVIYAFDKY